MNLLIKTIAMESTVPMSTFDETTKQVEQYGMVKKPKKKASILYVKDKTAFNPYMAYTFKKLL